MTRLSNRQRPMLEAFVVDRGSYPPHYMSMAEAQKYDQRPFRSMLIRKWVAYHPGRGFRITKEGLAAWEEFHSTEIFRKNPQLPLTAYFDPTAYGLKPKLRVMPRKEAAA